MNKLGGETEAFERVPTGLPGLDRLLNGGLFQGGVYLVMGPAGAGKTILANQMSFYQASRGGRTLYVTLLAEAHSRMFGHLRQFDFFDEARIGDSLNYLAAYRVLEEGGLDGLLKQLGEMVRKFKATMICIDGIGTVQELAESPVAFKRFVHQLHMLFGTSGCTTLLLSFANGKTSRPEHAIVDGVLNMTIQSDGRRSYREVEVMKFRGSAHLEGKHTYRISTAGIKVWPRLESFLGMQGYEVPPAGNPLSIGVPGLDSMLGDGFLEGSITSLLGPAGTGKTTLGCQFLSEGAERGENGMYLGLYEVPARLLQKLEKVHIPLREHIEAGRIDLIWHPQLELSADEVFTKVLDRIREKRITRLFIDGIAGIHLGMLDKSRLIAVMSALSIELRRLRVTTVFVEETQLWPNEVHSPVTDFSAVTDNIIFLRQFESEAEFRLFVSVIKSRQSKHETRIMEARLTEKGFEVIGPFQGMEGILTGVSRKKPSQEGEA